MNMMISITELFAVLCVGVLPSLVAVIFWKHLKDDQTDKKRGIQASIQLVQSLGALAVVFYIAMQQQNGLLSVGIDLGRSEDLIGGVFVFSFFIIFYAFGYRLIMRKEQEVDYSRYDVKQMLLYRTPIQRLLRIGILVIAAVSEEVVFRGYFLLLWGTRTDSLILCAIASSIVFVILHLYQGKKVIVYHVIFASVLAASTILSGSIMLAIGAHVYCNLLIQIKLWVLDANRKTESSIQPPPLPSVQIEKGDSPTSASTATNQPALRTD